MHDYNSTNSSREQGQRAEQTNEFGGTDLSDAGLRAAARGWKIFPCNGKKRPLTRNGCYDGTTDEQQIRSWAKQYPGALWAYALPKGIVVIDLDTKHGNNGIKEFEKLQHGKPEGFNAPRVRTGTGGMHLYTNANGQDFKNSRSAIAPGIDTRSLGGYVIIPSGPDSGYRWLSDPNTPIPPIPAWAEIVLRRASNFETNCEARPFQGFSVFGDAMLASACDAIATAPGGTQESTLNDRSYQIGRYVGGGLLERDATIEALVVAGVQMKDCDPAWEWTEKEVRFKVKRAIDAGILKPLDDGTEADRRTQEVLDRVFNDPQYAKEVEDFLEAEDAKRATEQSAEPEQDQQDPPKAEAKQESARAPPFIQSSTEFVTNFIPPDYLIDGLLQRRFIYAMTGPTGEGKTSVALLLALLVATGTH
jgi:hypothetical protein